MKKILIYLFLVKNIFSQIDVLFTPKRETYLKFFNLLNSSQKSIYISTYSLNPDFLQFLGNKKIDIKVICESGYLRFGKVKKFEEKGLFHSKFIIIDENKVIVSSANLSEEHFYKNHNNLVIIEDRKIVEKLTKKFDSLWNDYQLDEDFNFGKVRFWFSPENDCEGVIKDMIENSKKSIYFASYTFTDKEIARKLIEKRKKLEISGIIESNNIVPYSVFYLLLSYGINVKKSNFSGLLHDKFFIFDREKVITGSFNPTEKAKGNFEILLLIEDKDIAEKFYKEWKQIYIFKSITEKF